MNDTEIKERSKTLCRWCERTIWLYIAADGSLDSDIWTADGETIVCHSAPTLDGIQMHKPIERTT